MPNEDASDTLIRFVCAFCGQRIHIPKASAGKKGKCPKCKNIVIIPQPISASPAQNKDEPLYIENDSDFLAQTDRPLRPAPAEPTPTNNDQFQMLQQSAGMLNKPEPPPQRKLPLLIDIFLYPANLHALLFLGIVVLVPFALRLLAFCLGMFAVLLIVLDLIIGPIIFMYTYWYLAQCVRDSGAGNIRAPDTVTETPGVWELLGQVLRILACLVVCAAPAIVYFCYMHRTDPFFRMLGNLWYMRGTDRVFLVLACCGVFVYPMALLAVIMFDSISGLNPLIVIPSIFSTIFRYCGLLILIGAILFLFVQTQKFLPDNYSRFLIYPLVEALDLYLAMIAAHLLGCFYYRYQGKLNWDI